MAMELRATRYNRVPVPRRSQISHENQQGNIRKLPENLVGKTNQYRNSARVKNVDADDPRFFHGVCSFLQVENTEKYICSYEKEQVNPGNRSLHEYIARVDPQLFSTSIVTFSGPNGIEKEPRDKKLVQTNSIVTIYGNSPSGPKYLHAVKAGRRLLWKDLNPNAPVDQKVLHQFRVRVTNEPKKRSRLASFAQLKRMSRSYTASKINSIINKRRGSRRQSLQMSSQTPYSGLAQGRPADRLGGSFSNTLARIGQVQAVDDERPDQPDRRKHLSSVSYMSTQTNLTALPNSNNSLLVNDYVTLESVAFPGFFLTVGNRNELYLTKRPQRYLIKFPALSDLLKHGLAERVIKEKTLQKVELTDEEKSLGIYLQELPLELAFQIMSFSSRWTKKARLTSRFFKRVAEQNIGKLRMHTQMDGLNLAKKQGLFTLMKKCPNLREISVRNVDELKDIDFELLLSESNTPATYRSIVSLAFGGCRSVGDGFIDYLSMFPNLKSLNIAVTSVTDKGLQKLGEKSPRIENLNLYGCEKITQYGVLELIAQLKHLKEVNIRGTHVPDIPQFATERDVSILTGPKEFETIYS